MVIFLWFFQNSSSSGTDSMWGAQLGVSDNYEHLQKRL